MDSLPANKLLDALETGDFQTALPLLPKDGPLITIGPEGFTPLHYACRHGEAEVTRLLITQYHYSIKSTSIHGQTPAHVAAKYGHVDALRALVEIANGRDSKNDTGTSSATSGSVIVSSLHDQEGNTPLHTATACGRLPVVKYLIHDLQCGPACTNLKSETPLHLAAKNGHLGVIKYILNEGGCPTSPVDEYGGTPLYTAAGHGQIEVVQYLVEDKACDPNVRTTKRWEGEWKGSKPIFVPGRNPMHTASREGHLNILHYLVDDLECDPSCRDEDGVTPLHLASQQGHLAIVKFLVIECQCDPNVVMNDGRTPLHTTCCGRKLDVLQFLIGNGCDPEVKDQQGRTPLHYASMIGHLEAIQYLINVHQVEPSCQDDNRVTPLHLASKNGHLSVVRFLTEKGHYPLSQSSSGNTPVSDAALYGRLDVLKFFLTEKGCDPKVRSQWDRTLVHDASQEGHLETVQYLINEHHVDPSCQDENSVTALDLATGNGHLAVVHFLTERGCDPLARNRDGNTPVSLVALDGRLDVLKFFITEKGCDPMVRGRWNRSLVHDASQEGHLETVQYLINEHQVDPSCQDKDSVTPLHLAVVNGHLPVVCFLTEKGCDPLAKNKDGNTPLSSAALNGRLDILKFFITKKGCDPKAKDLWDRTLVHDASQEGHHETVQYLIRDHQVNPSCVDKNGWTALHLASMKGHLEVVKVLVGKAHCDPFQPVITQLFQITPMSLAVEYNHEIIALYFHSKGVPMPKGYSPTGPHLEFRVGIYCIGNQSVGKSTLVKALCTEGAWFGSLWNVGDVASETAGIVPFEFNSGIYGKVTFYDFSGHKEYYASHEVVFEKETHSVFLLTVNISEDDETICTMLRYWKQFLVNIVSGSSCRAHAIIVGSHADLVSSQLQGRRSFLLEKFNSKHPLQVVDSVLLDCRKPSSSGMSKLRELLEMICKRIRIQSQFDYHNGGILKRFIDKYLKEDTVIAFRELLSRIQNNPESGLEHLRLPELLYHTCKSLSISGHVLLLEDHPKESWIIIRKKVILSQIHGLLKHMKQSSELGIVPLSLIESLLQKHAPDLSPDLAIWYMEKVALCSEVDTQALDRIKYVPQEASHTNEKYFFFSCLVSAEKPNQVREWSLEQSLMYPSGWYLKCTNADHFFTPRFLQVLLMELACQFALKINQNLPGLVEFKQGCVIWKNGIRWLDRSGIEVIAEVDADGKSLCLTLKSLDKAKLQCTYLRSTLIHLILKLKGRLCGELELEEYLIHPMYFERSAPSQYARGPVSKPRSPQPVLIQVSDVADALLKHEDQIVVDQSCEGLFLSIEDLLYFEPYQGIGLELLQALYNPHNQQKVIENQQIENLAGALHVRWECIAIAMKTRQSTVAKLRLNNRATESEKCIEILKEWSGGKGTHSALRHDLDQYSIFCGRNLLDFCSIRHELEQRKQEQVMLSTSARDPLPSDIGVFLQLTDPSPLDESSVDVLAETLVECSHLWFHLGLVFGLSYGRLKAIQFDTISSKERQVKTLHSWLCLRDQVLQQGQPSWRTLVRALTHPLVDEVRLAEELAETHKVHVGESDNAATPHTLSSSDPPHTPPSHSTASST